MKSKNAFLGLSCMILFSFLGVVLTSNPVLALDVTVCKAGEPTCNYSSIGLAISAVSGAGGGTVTVTDDNIYDELVRMKDGVNLISSHTDKAHIRRSSGSGKDEVVGFSGEMTCDLKGFEITNPRGGAGIFMSGSGAGIAATVENCDIHNCKNAGIRLDGVVSPTIAGCNIYDNNKAGIVTAKMGTNDELTSGSSVTIKGNTIGGSGQGNGNAGIYLDGSGSGIQVTIGGSVVDEDNTISYNTDAGIKLEDIDQVIIENNDIFNNSEAGMLLIDVSTVSPHIKNNDIYNHAGEAGINIGGSSNVTIGDNNDIYSNRAGIVFYVSTNSRVTGSASSQPVTITGNNIYSNSYAGIGVLDPISNTQETTITENDIYLNGADGGGGIGIQNQCKLVITKNKIRDNVRGGIHTGKDLAGGVGFLGTNGSADLTIKQNKVYSNGGNGYGGGIDVRHASGTVYNNLVYENHKGGIRFGDYITHIVNNTVVDNGNDNGTAADPSDDRGGGIIYDNLAGAVNDTPAGNPPVLPIRNNICAYNQKAGIRACFDNTSEERDYNLLYDNNYTGGNCSGRYMAKQLAASECGLPLGADPDVTNAANEKCGDPLFIDRDNDDYRIQSGSPAVDAGDTSYGTDAGIPPGVGTSTIDMGAYGGPYGID